MGMDYLLSSGKFFKAMRLRTMRATSGVSFHMSIINHIVLPPFCMSITLFQSICPVKSTFIPFIRRLYSSAFQVPEASSNFCRPLKNFGNSIRWGTVWATEKKLSHTITPQIFGSESAQGQWDPI